MDSQQAKDKKVSPKDAKAYGSEDPFQSQGRVGRTPAAAETKPGRIPKTKDPVEGPAARTRAMHRKGTDATSTEDDVPSSILDTDRTESLNPLRTVVKKAERPKTRSLSRSGTIDLNPEVLHTLLSQMQRKIGSDNGERAEEEDGRLTSNGRKPLPKVRRQISNPTFSGDEEKPSRRSKKDSDVMSLQSRERIPIQHAPNRGHLGLYLPRSASIFNPFLNLKFAGTGDKLHPVLFMRKFLEIARFEGTDQRSQLHYFSMCLTGSASTWWSSLVIEDIRGALKAFKRKYWSTSQQFELAQRILIGRYVSQRDGTMSDYVARCQQENNFLDNPMPEREFVAAMTGHFNEQIERELRVSLIRTVEQLLLVLDEIVTRERPKRHDGFIRDRIRRLDESLRIRISILVEVVIRHHP